MRNQRLSLAQKPDSRGNFRLNLVRTLSGQGRFPGLLAPLKDEFLDFERCSSAEVLAFRPHKG